MNDARLAHPSLDQLAAFAQGRLNEAEMAELASHLGQCRECVASVEASRDDTLISLLRTADTGNDRDVPPTPGEAATLALPGETSGIRDLPVQLAAHGRYRIQELLGVGGMGAVYKAEHLLMERPVALKLISNSLTSNPGMVERFRREVKTAGQLRHPNIVMAYDAEQAGDSHFLVMEHVEGKSLARVVTEQGPLPVREACEYIRQAAVGLQHAHERGMVHRDIKPQNLMLTPDGQVKILDFGLARFAMEAAPTRALLAAPMSDTASCGSTTGSLTQAGAVMGTPDYIAPEQAKDAHTADIRADIYSLGCTLYDLLAGHAPFPEGTVIDKVMAHAERSPRPLTEVRDDVSPTLARVVACMMAKEPAERFQTPAEVAAALAPFASVAKPAESRGRKRRRTLAMVGALAAVTAILLGGVIYFATDNGRLRVEGDVDDIELIISKAGKQYEVIDLKSGTRVKKLPTGDYQIALKGDRTDVKLNKDAFTITRRGEAVVTVTQEPVLSAADKDAKIAAASKAAEAYLKKVDTGDYGELWDQVAAWAKEHGPSKEQAIETYKWLAKQSGKLKSRTPAKPQYLTAVPSVGEGEYVVFGYESRFEHYDPAAEQLVLMLDKDGQWRAVGYLRLAGGAPSAPQDVRADGPAVVGPAQARFVIPVEDKKTWSWYLPTTPGNQEEYRWTVKVANNAKSYSLGFSLYKREGQKPASGTLAELLNAGQVNLWSSTKDGAAVIEGDVRVRAEGNRIVVTINDKKLLTQLFSSKPAVVEFESGLPGDEKVVTRIVDVAYEGESATPAKNPKKKRPPGEGVPPKYRESINKGLEYLAQAQQKDGHWGAEGGSYPTAITALAGMALLMEGSTPEDGKYADSLRRAVDWLMKRSQASGLIDDPAGENRLPLFSHGYAMLFLASVYGQEENGERRAKLEKILTKAVEFTGDAQSTRGGWGYVRAADGNNFDEGASTVVQLQGLRAARNAGIVVPKKLIDIDYLRRCTTKNGGIIYSITRPEDGDRPALTAAALACMYTAGEYDSDLARKWLKYSQQSIPLDGARIGHDEFTHYYYAQALYILGDQGYEKLFADSKPDERLTWSKYREAMFDSLLKRQDADGSWHTKTVGPVYSTALWLTVLQLDDATLPIYRR